jgi:O-antigen/teichoic acid export membrane protein
LGAVARAFDPLIRGWAVMTASHLARLALTFLASILIARHLGPADFGVYAVLGVLMNIAGVVADAGLTVAGVRQIAATQAAELGRAQLWGQSLFWLRAGLAVLVFAAGTLLAVPISRYLLDLPGRPGLVPLALLGMVLVALTGALNAIFQATGRFRQIAAVNLVNASLTTGLAVLLAWAGRLNLVTALLVLGLGTSLAGLAAGRRLLPPGWSLRFPGLARLKQDGGQLAPFSRWVGLANLLAVLAAYLDILLVNRLSPPAELGLFALALNLSAKVDIVNQSLYTVLLPAVSGLKPGGQLRGYARRSLGRGLLLGLALLPLALLARPFITLFYGQQYEPAATYFQLLLAVVLFDILANPLLLLALPLNRPALLAAIDGLRVVVLATAALWLVPRYGPAGAIAAKMASRVVAAAFAAVALRRASAAVASPKAEGGSGVESVL